MGHNTLDNRKFKICWDLNSSARTVPPQATSEIHTVASLREKFGSTNLFSDDDVWENGIEVCFCLDGVFRIIAVGEEWTSQNCTISLA